jgi:hypothetical protein
MFPRRRAAQPRFYGARVKEICPFLYGIRASPNARVQGCQWEIAVVLVPLHVADALTKMYSGYLIVPSRAAPPRCRKPC